jgi:1-aminocyclopropane-1-carboxylate deaminase/D-cysteine desulfhydrase-like pyridoxal-dependent ACC family enzyme
MNEPMTHATNVLLNASIIINNDRNNTYGHVVDDYNKVRNIFHALTGIELDLHECLMFMASVKLARIRTNLERDILHKDSLTDLIGYLALQAEISEPK